MKKQWVLLILIIVMIGSLLGCAKENIRRVGADANVETIKIGVVEPLSGANEAQGLLELQGIELAHEQYSTVLGQPIELVCVDSQSDIIQAPKVTQLLLEQENISAVIGSFGNLLSMASGPQYKKMQIPAVASTCTNPLVTLGNPYYFRVCATDLLQGVIMAQYAFSDLGFEKYAVLSDETDQDSIALAQAFNKEIIKLSEDETSVVYDGSYILGDKNFLSQLETIQELEAEALFIPGSIEDAVTIINQIKELEMDIQIIGADWWETTKLMELGGNEIEGVIFCNFTDYQYLKTERTDEFYKGFKAKFGEESKPALETILAYDAYLLTVDAIKRAESTIGIDIRKALSETEYFIGASGIFKIDENGDVMRTAVIKTVENRKFVNKGIRELPNPMTIDSDPATLTDNTTSGIVK